MNKIIIGWNFLEIFGEGDIIYIYLGFNGDLKVFVFLVNCVVIVLMFYDFL